jgi:predicted MFS family arabinose efflux permease
MMSEAIEGGALAAPAQHRGASVHFSLRECLLLFVLAAVQFTHIVDFMIIMPLGSRFINEGPLGNALHQAGLLLMQGSPMTRAAFAGHFLTAAQGDGLRMTTTQFGFVVSAYTISAGLASLLAARFLDRFDRKGALLFLFAGFSIGTVLCGVATTYLQLLLARAVAGAFGGVCAANVLAIIGDVFHDVRRGTATGVVMSAFSIAAIAGVPLGLYLSAWLGWRAPFLVLGGLGAAVTLLAAWVLPSLRGHLGHAEAAQSTWEVATDPNHLRAFVLMFALVSSSFLIGPYLPTFLVANVGLTESDLPLMYLAGGIVTLGTLTAVGWLADRYGKLLLFRILALSTMVPLFLVTVLPHGLHLVLVLTVTTVMFVTTSGRMVPGMALITNSSTPQVRGSFMSFNSAVQQLGAGLAAVVGGLLLGKAEDGRITGFPVVGVLACVAALASVYLAGRLRTAPGGTSAPDAEAVEAPEPEPPSEAPESENIRLAPGVTENL